MEGKVHPHEVGQMAHFHTADCCLNLGIPCFDYLVGHQIRSTHKTGLDCCNHHYLHYYLYLEKMNYVNFLGWLAEALRPPHWIVDILWNKFCLI